MSWYDATSEGMECATSNLTRTVLVFATERKNNVDPRSQKKVNNIQLFFTKLTGVHLMCQIFTYRTRSTKVKSDQVNY